MKYYFNLNMTSQDFLPYYQGQVRVIKVTTLQGLTLEFPAMHLRAFLTAGGIKGQFCLQTKHNKFISLNKIA
ncbi:Protein of unknown function [Colwellia chukchiensis]|uniref:DUF2835 domain-containing protein n=1 Tax=Colwellia chukchiensis TaxID=641665 RepID=A0A1H7M823_9GAMM|nr:DUF2835 domain-containing protein [Colwellia chukchiensis]SEL07416.1 Protein of unknown function [Colwellia chukchiensis]